jgi:uncharacterized membrane protein YqjE
MADNDRSIAAVLSDIVGDVQQIIRAEVRLAKIEVSEDLTKAKRGVMFLVVAGVAFAMALGFLELALVYALATIWPAWAAGLTVAALNVVVGAVLASTGLGDMKRIHLPPPRTTETLKENLQWAKTRGR